MAKLEPLPTLSGFGRFDVIDLRGMAPRTPAGDIHKKWRLDHKGSPIVRSPADVLGVGLHQTGVVFGVGKAAIAAADGDSIRAKTLRALNVHAPVVCFLWGPGPPRIVLTCPLLWWTNHGNALNPFTIGLEVEGKYPGRIRLSKPLLNDDQRECLRQAIKVCVELGRAEGCPMTSLWGHRQTNGKKPADPGEEVWGEGVVEYARPVLGLRTELDRSWPGSTPVTPHGFPIPQCWDPEAKASYL